MIPHLGLFGDVIFVACHYPAVAQCEYRCEHGHVMLRWVCPRHEQALAGRAGCIQCFRAGRECPMRARLVRDVMTP